MQFVLAKGAGDAALRRLDTLLRRHSLTENEALNVGRSDFANELKLRPDVAENILHAQEDAIRLSDTLERNEVEVLWLGDPLYPQHMKDTLGKDAPPVLFARGNLDLLKKPSVGFTGSRKASGKGLCITEGCAAQLAKEDVCVVSGYAQGVDLTAHRAAIESGGSTIFVLVEGILRYKEKPDVRGLLNWQNYLVISQFPPNLTWSGRNAMKRNSTIIGLSSAMILVESAMDGGTFACGDETLRRKHPLFVVEYANPVATAEANPYFIQKGGVPIRSGKDGFPNIGKLLSVVSAGGCSAPPKELFDIPVRTSAPEKEGQYFTDKEIKGIGRRMNRALKAYQDSTSTESLQKEPEQSSPAEQIEQAAFRIIQAQLDEPMEPAKLQEITGLKKGQLDDWLKKMQKQGLIKKKNKPVRYVAKK